MLRSSGAGGSGAGSGVLRGPLKRVIVDLLPASLPDDVLGAPRKLLVYGDRRGVTEVLDVGRIPVDALSENGEPALEKASSTRRPSRRPAAPVPAWGSWGYRYGGFRGSSGWPARRARAPRPRLAESRVRP